MSIDEGERGKGGGEEMYEGVKVLFNVDDVVNTNKHQHQQE